MIELYLLMVFILISAVVAVESHDLLSSVISVGAVGLGLCIVFLLLGAPELAITQLVVEILALIILIRATIAKTVPEIYQGREFLSYLMSLVFIASFALISFLIARDLPAFGAPVMKVAQVYLQEGLGRTGVTSLISAITFDYRALDTLGAAAVLFASVIGVLAVLRPKGRKH